MSFNVAGAVQLPLTVFGSLVTETPPANLPEGVSPDCQDVVFVPGAVGSRPGYSAVFATPFGTATVTYAKSFVDPTGVVRNLYLDSAGNLWVENISTSPGTYILLTATTPSSYAKSVTCFGREYIAISDGLHGTEVPLQYDGTNLDRVTQDGPGGPPSIICVDIDPQTISALSCASNVADCVTASAHGLLEGYQAQISNVAPSVAGTSISSIVIDNEQLPGIATVETSDPHGLAPGQIIVIGGVEDVAAPAVSAIFSSTGVLTIVFGSAHGLSQGASITVFCSSNLDYQGSFIIALIVSPIAIAINVPGLATGTGTSAGTSVNINWPLPDTGQPAYFEVIAAPSSTTFQVQFAYTDGTWTSGYVSYSWNGTFFVASVISATEFTYQFQAPDSTATLTGPETATPFGQAAPGQHQMQVMFLTRNGAITRPSPPVKFTANGGQYLSISNIPIGPPNVVARILAFTSALGANFFYIPVPDQVNGQVVSTATQINDNTSDTAVFDFSDPSLLDSISINTPGNNLPDQIVLDGALGFGFYASRLITYGQRNCIQNLLNLGFDGGYFPAASTIPTGWTPSGSGGALAPGHFGTGWQISSGGILFQGFYEDAYGAPIATANATYTARAWLQGVAGSLTVTISSTLTGFTSTATLPSASSAGAWVQANFSLAMPDSIPIDMTLIINGSAVLVDDLSIIYAQSPYLDTILYGSYVDNPEGFDGLSGKFGPSQDARKVMTFGIIRDTMYLLTQDPSGRIHAAPSSATTEPVGWLVEEVAANCGALSAFCLTVSQADDTSASGGEEWFAWASASGARIFGGDQPWKISQEIQPDWSSINQSALLTIWALNDPVSRLIYFGLPIGTSASAPTLIYPCDYKELDTSFQIAQGAPVHTSFSGKLIATDHTRKWTRWNATMNGAALVYRQPGQLLVVMFGGNGQYPGSVAGTGNVYILCPNQLTDDDFGQMSPYYTTYFFPSHDQEQGMGLGGQRKQLQYFQFLVSGVGNITVTPLVNSLNNPWNFTCVRAMSTDPTYDLEWPGASAIGQRIAFKFESSPAGG